MIRDITHYGHHYGLPLVVAYLFFKPHLWKAYGLMLLGLLIDLDHLLATPIFNPNRCSINFHPLHSYWAIGCYVLLCIPKTTHLIGLGLIIHIIADISDCLWM